MAQGDSVKDGLNAKPSGRDVEQYHFLSRKYGSEMLIDIGRMESLPNFIRDDTPHRLSFYEISFIEKGEGTFMLDQHVVEVEPGVVIFTSPGQIRRWNTIQPLSGNVLFFEKDFLNLFFTDELFLYRFQYFHQHSRPTSMKMSDEGLLQALTLVRNIEEEFAHLQNDSRHLVRAILYQLLVILNRHYANYCQIERDTFIHPDFLRFRFLLEKDFKSCHRVAEHAGYLKMSPTHLNKICRQYSGFSAQQMIHHKLVSEIKKKLACQWSVKEIAYDFGFSDPSNFNRFFKKVAGMTAQQYRDGI